MLCVVITVVIVEANNTKKNNNATFKFKLPPPPVCFFIPGYVILDENKKIYMELSSRSVLFGVGVWFGTRGCETN